MIEIGITNACNADCVFCWHHSPLLRERLPTSWRQTTLSAAAVHDLLKDVYSLGGLEKINIAGKGEPLVHPEIGSIIEIAKLFGLHLTLTTNLVAPNALLARGADELTVSIHAASEAVFRAIHPGCGKDDWSRLLSNLEVVAAAGCSVKHTHVINRLNAHEIPDMVKFGANYGASRVNFKLANLGNGTEAVRVTEGQRTNIIEEWLPEAATVARRLGVKVTFDTLAFQIGAGCDGKVPIEDVGCLVGDSFARITAEGTVLYCCNTQMVVGRLSEASFSELWDGPQWTAYREALAKGEFFSCCRRCGNLKLNLKLARLAAGRA